MVRAVIGVDPRVPVTSLTSRSARLRRCVSFMACSSLRMSFTLLSTKQSKRESRQRKQPQKQPQNQHIVAVELTLHNIAMTLCIAQMLSIAQMIIPGRILLNTSC